MFQTMLWKLPLSIIILLLFWLAIVYTLSVTNVALFVFFRKECEIKATSVPLTMWIFLGSFLMLVSSTIRVLEGRANSSFNPFYDRYISCNVVVIIGSTGFDLILATTLVKTLRIWNIFRHFGKLGKSWSNLRLGVIILVLISIKIFIFGLWVSIDTYHLVETLSFQPQANPPYFMTIHTCFCNYFIVWSVAGITYTLILLSLLIVLAIKTRSVHRKDFKDTKKILFVVISQQITLVALTSVWLALEESLQSDVVYSLVEVSMSVTVFVIHVFLLSPKVLPPLLRFLKKKWKRTNKVKSKLSNR